MEPARLCLKLSGYPVTRAFPREEIPSDVLTNDIIACSVETTKVPGFGDSNDQEAAIIDIAMDYRNNITYNSFLYIYEESNQLILGTFIGEPDDFVPQDYMKAEN